MKKKVKNIAYLGMVFFSFIMLSFGNEAEPFNRNISLWIVFALINMIYWGGKWLMNGIDMLLDTRYENDGETKKKYKSKKYNAPQKSVTLGKSPNVCDISDYEDFHESHKRYMPKDNTAISVSKRKVICDNVKLKPNIKIISINKEQNAD